MSERVLHLIAGVSIATLLIPIIGAAYSLVIGNFELAARIAGAYVLLYLSIFALAGLAAFILGRPKRRHRHRRTRR